MGSNQNVIIDDKSSIKQQCLKTFDLIQVGVCGTFAIGAFIVIGCVLKNVSGPSIILSISSAMILAIFAGIFYVQTVFAIIKMYDLNTKVNCISQTTTTTTTTTSKLLMPSYVLSYLYIGEWAGFAIAWNLLLEYAIGISMISKCLSSYFESIVFDNNSLIQPDDSNPTTYFTFSSFFIPILAGVPLLLLLPQLLRPILVSIIFGSIVFGILFIVGILKGNLLNWNSIPSDNINNVFGDGGFFPYGLLGTFRGSAILLFLFIGFDSMVLPPLNWNQPHPMIKNFRKTVLRAICFVTGIIFVALILMSALMITIKPYDEWARELQIVKALVSFEWIGLSHSVSIIIIVALLGNLYSLMNSILKVLQAMSPAKVNTQIKLFANYHPKVLQQQQQQNKQNESKQKDCFPIAGCLITSVLAGIFAGLFSVEQMIKVLSVGTILMFYSLSLNMLILRSLPKNTENTDKESKKRARRIKCLLFIFTFLCKVLAVIIKTIHIGMISLNVFIIIVICVLVGLKLIIIFFISRRRRGNLIFSFKIHKNPIFPGFVLFATVYLATLLEVISWIRYVVWMNIGGAIYIALLLYNYFQKKKNAKMNLDRHSQNDTTDNNGSVEENFSQHGKTDCEEISTVTAVITMAAIESTSSEEDNIKIENIEFNQSTKDEKEKNEQIEMPPVDYDQVSIEEEIELRKKSAISTISTISSISNDIINDFSNLDRSGDSQVIEINAIVHTELPETPISVVEVKDSNNISKNGILFVIGAYQPPLQQTLEKEMNGTVKKSKDFKNRLEQLLFERQSIISNNEYDEIDECHSIRSSADGDSLNEDNQKNENENVELSKEYGKKNVENDDPKNKENDVILRKPPVEVFDTVRKQKQKFESVLKEINPKIRTSLRRTDSKASNDFQHTYKF